MAVKQIRIDNYIQSVYKLAGSLVIKLSAAANSINKRLVETYGESSVGPNPNTWKYYLNLNGQYHSTDTAIIVNRLDPPIANPPATISFDSTQLALNPITRNVYKYGTNDFYKLVSDYPGYLTVIKGALYPVNITDAINAEDGTILAYESDFVEENEWYLIPELESWIKRWLSRWNEEGFLETDDLYGAAMYGVLTTYLPLKIIELRQHKIGTREAHSFHRRMSITTRQTINAIRGDLDIDDEQWLYRNSRYITVNQGTNKVLKSLIENITANGKVSVGYLYRRQIGVMQGLLPEVIYRNIIQNEGFNSSNIGTYDKEEVYRLEELKAMFNKDIDSYFPNQEVKYTKYSDADTKVIISDMTDKGDFSSHPYEQMLYEYYPYMADSLYNSVIFWTNPVNNRQHTITQKDLVLIYIYYLSKYYGYTPTNMPSWAYTHVSVSTNASIILANKPADVKVDDDINFFNTEHIVPAAVSNVSMYVDMIKDIYTANKKMWLRVTSKGNKIIKGVSRNMWFKFFEYGNISLGTGYSSYSNFFTSKGIDISTTLSKKEIKKLLAELRELSVSTIEDKKLRNIQETILEIIDKNTSYTSHIAKNMSDTKYVYCRQGGIGYTPGTITQYYQKVHPVTNEPPHADIDVTGDWFLVSFDQLSTAQKSQLKDVY